MNKITVDEFCAHVEDADFFLRYGNPVAVMREGKADVVCMEWEYYERLMSAVHGDVIGDGAMASFAVCGHPDPDCKIPSEKKGR